MNETHTGPDSSPALSPFDRLAWQSMNVWERLDSSTPSSSDETDLASHPGLGRLVAMWMKALAPDRADLLGRRLRWDGYDELDLIRAVSADSVTIPSHLRQAVELIGDLPESSAAMAILATIPEASSIPFSEIWSSFVHAGVTRLGGIPEVIAEPAFRELQLQLMIDLQRACGRPMFEPRMKVVSENAGAELNEMANAKWRWLDEQLGTRDNICCDRFTLADLIAFCFANFGFTVGWKLPEGTDNLARFIDTHNARESAQIWQQAE